MTTRPAVAFFAVAAATFGAATFGARAARADVTWEHVGTLQSSMFPKKPFLKVKMYNTWTAQRHRLLLNYAFAPSLFDTAGAMSGRMPSMPMLKMTTRDAAEFPDFKPQTFGSLGFVQRLDDDRVLAYESQSRTLISEERLSLLKRLRFKSVEKACPRTGEPGAADFDERAAHAPAS